ncbi:probable RNA polymerase II nuclear localization protein SLC7A6OS [Corythoichthys intestinalis]|uniref:probable RNA polymerase II nuclear localization protein SLC7A6OS n=1 Tax=Corythoichthys intestinalis TaxID=161448 RepID=UPI0025A5CEDF|nr:probable RNA polymerase II nuclear localization protein SLC7A6OS [Corythoichthys intestinalis]XP_061796830.1 probable RNA polymerase II nuclear localization protein SLC7A6OS [Nerophis lumbriciformis]
MEPNATILRVKRKRGTDPADALLLACKRIRPETSQAPGEAAPEPGEADVEKSVFKLVATVATQDAPVQTEVRQALSRPRVAHALRPSANSSKRIFADSRNAKLGIRSEERYRILSSHRAGLALPVHPSGDGSAAAEKVEETREEEVQVVDLLHEDLPEQDKSFSKTESSNPDVILCNNTKMLRERLRIQDQPLENDDDYVYDLYYQETFTPGWIHDILSVRAYADYTQLVPEEEDREEETYDDEDDENEEANWRNDYPDEESEDDDDSEREERYGREWADVEEDAPCRRSWQRYQRDLLKSLGHLSDNDTDEYDSD